MKKSILLIVIGAMCVSMLAGCSNSASDSASSSSAGDGSSAASSSGSGAESSSVSTSSSSETSYEIIDGDYTAGECLVLPEYKGLELTETIQTASDEYVDEYVASLADTEEVDDENATVEEGDTVNIVYEGTIDGETFDGGSSDSYDLQIGSDTFIDGFEDGLIGMKAGEEKDLDLTFPEDYASTDYAGKDVVFHVTVNTISRPAEQDDAWADEYSGGEYTTLEAFKEYSKEMLNESFEQEAESELYNNAWNEVLENTEFLKIPRQLIDDGEEVYDALYENYASYYGLSSAEEYYEYVGMTDEDIAAEKADYSEMYATDVLLAEAILEAEGIATDSDEVTEQYEQLAESQGMTTDELIEQYGEARIYMYSVCTVANEIMVENANITEEYEEV